MHVIEPGHIYLLARLDSAGDERLTFVNRGNGNDHPGTTCQEVLRALIDRVQYMNRQRPWSGNEELVCDLRTALARFEARSLIEHTKHGKIATETIPVNDHDGHFAWPHRHEREMGNE